MSIVKNIPTLEEVNALIANNKVTVDTSLSSSSTNPVQNKVVYSVLNKTYVYGMSVSGSTLTYNLRNAATGSTSSSSVTLPSGGSGSYKSTLAELSGTQRVNINLPSVTTIKKYSIAFGSFYNAGGTPVYVKFNGTASSSNYDVQANSTCIIDVCNCGDGVVIVVSGKYVYVSNIQLKPTYVSLYFSGTSSSIAKAELVYYS